MEERERSRRMRAMILGTAVFAMGIFVASRVDLLINQLFYNPQNPVAIAFECFGYYPMYLTPVLWVLLLATDRTAPPLRRALAGAASFFGVLGLFAYSSAGLLDRGISLALVFSGGVWLIMFTFLRMLLQVKPAVLRRVRFALGWGVLYAAAGTVLVNVLKLIWQRTRFDDMLKTGGFEAFTPWYSIPGNGGSSFPSGHTTAACGIFVLILLCDVLPAWRRHSTGVWRVCWAYIFLLAAHRVIIGRHYLSDTLVAAFLMALLLFFMRQMEFYQNGVKAICAADHVPRRHDHDPMDKESGTGTANDANNVVQESTPQENVLQDSVSPSE